MSKELHIPFDKLRDPKFITKQMEREFEKHGLDLHVNEVEQLDDDENRGVRILRVKNTKYFFR